MDIKCQAHVPTFYVKIVCPALDNLNENKNIDISKDDDKCKPADDNSNGLGCFQIVRRILSTQIVMLANFVCFCVVKLQGVEIGKNMASVEVKNHGMQGICKGFFISWKGEGD